MSATKSWSQLHESVFGVGCRRKIFKVKHERKIGLFAAIFVHYYQKHFSPYSVVLGGTLSAIQRKNVRKLFMEIHKIEAFKSHLVYFASIL
jgi:hypothetical protein